MRRTEQFGLYPNRQSDGKGELFRIVVVAVVPDAALVGGGIVNTPPGNEDLAVLFIFPVLVAFLILVYLFLVYFFARPLSSSSASSSYY